MKACRIIPSIQIGMENYISLVLTTDILVSWSCETINIKLLKTRPCKTPFSKPLY